MPCFHCSFGCVPGNKTEFIISANLTEEKFQENPIINWDAILWVNRPLQLWFIQLILAMISLVEALLLAYLGYKVRILGQCYTTHWRLLQQNGRIKSSPPRNWLQYIFLIFQVYFAHSISTPVFKILPCTFSLILSEVKIWKKLTDAAWYGLFSEKKTNNPYHNRC